jgi:hypothetical protein
LVSALSKDFDFIGMLAVLGGKQLFTRKKIEINIHFVRSPKHSMLDMVGRFGIRSDGSKIGFDSFGLNPS